MTDPSGAGDSQDVAESFDDDEVDSENDYSGNRPNEYPPDRPLGSLDQAITPAEEAFPESVAERARREEPDPLAEELDDEVEIEDDVETLDTDALADVEMELTGPTEDLFADLDDDEVAALDDRLASHLASGGDGDGYVRDPTAVGRLVDPESSVDDVPSYDDIESEEFADAEALEGDESAEEAAMHITSDPRWDRSDGYLEDR